jgi:hypothetical protein
LHLFGFLTSFGIVDTSLSCGMDFIVYTEYENFVFLWMPCRKVVWKLCTSRVTSMLTFS